MRLRHNFQFHNLTSSEQALKNASPLFCKLETSESSLFLGLEKKKYFSKVYFPPKWLENELLQKQVLDITFVRWVLDKTPYAKGQRQRKTSDYHHRWCLARSPSSDTIVGRPTGSRRLVVFLQRKRWTTHTEDSTRKKDTQENILVGTTNRRFY